MMKRSIFTAVLTLGWLVAGVGAAVLTKGCQATNSWARQSIARANLAQIHTLQKAHFARYGRYGGAGSPGAGSVPLPGPLSRPDAGNGPSGAGGCSVANQIGFEAGDCGKHRYDYRLESVGGGAYVAVARERTVHGERLVFPGCEGPLDEWQIDGQRHLKARHNALSSCESLRANMPRTPAQFGQGLLLVAGCAVMVAILDLVVCLVMGLGVKAFLAAGLLASAAAPLLVIGGAAGRLLNRGPHPDPITAVLLLLFIGAAVYLARGAAAEQAGVREALGNRFGAHLAGRRTGLLLALQPLLLIGLLFVMATNWG